MLPARRYQVHSQGTTAIDHHHCMLHLLICGKNGEPAICPQLLGSFVAVDNTCRGRLARSKLCVNTISAKTPLLKILCPRLIKHTHYPQLVQTQRKIEIWSGGFEGGRYAGC